MLIFGVIFENEVLIRERKVYNTNNLPATYKYLLPYFKQKIHIDIIGKDTTCKKYIADNKITLRLYKDSLPINLYQLNNMDYGKAIKIKITASNIDKDCNFILEIIDPYGNMEKTIATVILPFLVILYFLFKKLAVFIFTRLKRSKFTDNNTQ